MPASNGRAKVQLVWFALRERRLRRLWIGALAFIALMGLLIGTNVGGVRQQLLRRAAQSPIRSIAVLPLENLSRDLDQEYFADGMTETLITARASIGRLRRISATALLHYNGTRKTLP